ncbi:MAG TPA: SagB/ThcOx family dehydrogenase [Pyrinomonadaceae bacterium]|jgi:SagB-type dehydrogenase family enzyme
MLIQTSPTIRLFPPSPLRQQNWTAEDFLMRRRFSLSLIAALILIAAINEQEDSEVASLIAERTETNTSDVEKAIAALVEKRILLPAAWSTEENVEWFQATRELWETYGWAEAAEYHLATYDYRFAGGSDEGLLFARELMLTYSKDEIDANRFKSYENPATSHALPRPSEDLLSTPVLLKREPERRQLTKELLCEILSLAFGKTRSLQPQWNGAPVVLRTSPSGGARQPTEAYLIALDLPDLTSGWYHISMDQPALELLFDGVDEKELEQLFPTTCGRAPFRVRALLVLTSVFERNMYRYREPRTFRTVHMDAGHLAATVEFAAEMSGARTFVQYGGNEKAVEAKLGLDGLEEGVQLSISLG